LYNVLTLVPSDCTFQMRPTAIRTGSIKNPLKPKIQYWKRWQWSQNLQLLLYQNMLQTNFISTERIPFSVTCWFCHLTCIFRAGENKPESALTIWKQDSYF